jgi:hypothetical protein
LEDGAGHEHQPCTLRNVTRLPTGGRAKFLRSTAGPARTPFPGNIIPATRFNPVAQKILNFPLVALPNLPGQAFTAINNYSTTCTIGGNNNQENGRLDDTVSDKLRVFGRYSRWSSLNTACTL